MAMKMPLLVSPHNSTEHLLSMIVPSALTFLQKICLTMKPRNTFSLMLSYLGSAKALPPLSALKGTEMTPYKHAQSSAQKWGGIPEDYAELHDWFDETKQYTGDWSHRALRHHSAGVQWAIERFGHTITNSKDQKIPTKVLAEQHLIEDCGFIPTPQQYLSPLVKNPEKWMLQVGKTTKTQNLQVI